MRTRKESRSREPESRATVTARAEKGVNLHEATGDDIPILLQVLHAAFEEYRGRLDPPSGVHNETVETLRKKLKTGAAVLLQISDEVACGHAEGYALSNSIGLLRLPP